MIGYSEIDNKIRHYEGSYIQRWWSQWLILDNILNPTDEKRKYIMDKKYTIAVTRTGYVELSIATLLSQHHMYVA